MPTVYSLLHEHPNTERLMTNLQHSLWRWALGLSLLALAPFVAPGVQAQTAVPAPDAPAGRPTPPALKPANDPSHQAG